MAAASASRSEGGGDLGHHARQVALRRRPIAQLTDTVNLFGAVGELEIGGECADQVCRRGDRQLGQNLSHLLRRCLSCLFDVRLAGLLRQRPNPLDQRKQLRALLADQSVAEQRTHPTHVGAQVDSLVGPHRLLGAVDLRLGFGDDVVGRVGRCGGQRGISSHGGNPSSLL